MKKVTINILDYRHKPIKIKAEIIKIPGSKRKYAYHLDYENKELRIVTDIYSGMRIGTGWNKTEAINEAKSKVSKYGDAFIDNLAKETLNKSGLKPPNEKFFKNLK